MNQLSEVEAANSSSSNNDMPVLNEGIIVTHLLIVRDIAAECCNLRMGTTLRFYDPKTDVCNGRQRSGLYRRNHASRPNHGCTTYRAGTAGSFGNEYGYNSTNTEIGISQGGAE